MRPQHYNVRADRQTGKLFLVDQRPNRPIKRLADITEPVLMALAADVLADESVLKTERDIRFNDGGLIRLTIQDLTDEVRQPAEPLPT